MAIQTVQHPEIGLALAGGGVGGAIYEAGALRAIDDAFLGIDFCRLGSYVGISAGSLVAACLINGFSSKQLCRALIDPKSEEVGLRAEHFFKPAVGRMVQRSKEVPKRIWDILQQGDTHRFFESLAVLLRALPEGLFENDPLEKFMRKLFESKGCSNSFEDVDNRLFVVASDLDAAVPVVFGTEEWKDVPISKAVQASCALPGVYPPVEIKGRSYVDGVLLRTMNASVVLERGAKILFCINPIVPVDTAQSVERGFMKRGRLVDRGLLGVLHQSIRTLIYSRMKVGHSRYQNRFDDKTILLFEPQRDDYVMYFTNILSFSARHTLIDHAYKKTLEQIRARKQELIHVLAPKGISVREEVLNDPHRDIFDATGLPRKHEKSVTEKLDATLNHLEAWIDREFLSNP